MPNRTKRGLVLGDSPDYNEPIMRHGIPSRTAQRGAGKRAEDRASQGKGVVKRGSCVLY